MRKTLSKFATATDCIDKINELNNTYKRKFNRNSKVDLFYSYSNNPIGKPVHEITAHYAETDKDEVIFFEDLLHS